MEKINDNWILVVVKNLFFEEEIKEDGCEVILVSKDVLVCVKVDVIGLRVEDFLSDWVVEFNSIYIGFLEVYIVKELLS